MVLGVGEGPLETGGDGIRFHPENLIVDQILVGRFAIFCYLITDPKTKKALLLDPGAEPRKILDRVRSREARLRYIICSHTHPDHIGAVATIKTSTGAVVGVHELEASRIRSLSKRLMVRLMGGISPPKADLALKNGDVLQLGSHSIQILHTPGHSPGGICLVSGEHLFTGDTLFVGGVGRTDLPGASGEELANSIRNKILSLPGAIRIWPGHHYGEVPSNLLSIERRTNPFLKMIDNNDSPNVRGI